MVGSCPPVWEEVEAPTGLSPLKVHLGEKRRRRGDPRDHPEEHLLVLAPRGRGA